MQCYKQIAFLLIIFKHSHKRKLSHLCHHHHHHPTLQKRSRDSITTVKRHSCPNRHPNHGFVQETNTTHSCLENVLSSGGGPCDAELGKATFWTTTPKIHQAKLAKKFWKLYFKNALLLTPGSIFLIYCQGVEHKGCPPKGEGLQEEGHEQSC